MSSILSIIPNVINKRQAKGEIASKNDNLKQNTEVNGVHFGEKPTKLAEIGITRHESSAFQSMQDGFLLQ